MTCIVQYSTCNSVEKWTVRSTALYCTCIVHVPAVAAVAEWPSSQNQRVVEAARCAPPPAFEILRRLALLSSQQDLESWIEIVSCWAGAQQANPAPSATRVGSGGGSPLSKGVP
jgi:hypothetical protein